MQVVSSTSSMQKIENRTLSMLNQTGHHRFKSQLPLKAIWKVLKPFSQKLKQILKPKSNLSYNEHKALMELKNNAEINIKKADKGTTTVNMNKCDKIHKVRHS